jgi:predicted GH43/DUF377 family glycosyl hydrolase
MSWNKHAGNPVMQPGPIGSWDEDNIDNASVLIVGGTYHMWYSAVDSLHDNRIGHATSPDGIVWTKDPNNPVLDIAPPFNWDDHEVMHPFVMYEDPVYKMWYNGHDGLTQRILYATSPDGVNWSRFTAYPMLVPGLPGSWDDHELGMMCVLRANDGYHMWYTGWNQAFDVRIGYATSPDGLTWTKDAANNPVLNPGAPGSWDDAMVALPVVMLVDSTLTMWYGGTDGDGFHTGYATSQSTLVPTLLQSYAAVPTESGIRVDWRLSEAGSGMQFSALRCERPDNTYAVLRDATVAGSGLDYSMTDDNVVPGSEYRYRVDVTDEDGTRVLFETEFVSTPVRVVELLTVARNPFHGSLYIDYSITRPGPVRLDIYDVKGRLVRTLVDAPQEAGKHSARWFGLRRDGSSAASGVYFVRLESHGQVRTQKAVMAK